MKLVILAGGKGTRMGSLTELVPKPMVPVVGKPILEHQLELAKRHNLSDVSLLVSYKEDVIREYFKKGDQWGIDIDYFSDPCPLGTAGSVKEIERLLIEDFMVFYGDIMLDMDLDSLRKFHYEKGGIATLVVHPNDHPYDSDLVDINEENRVTAFYSKPHGKEIYRRNLVNAALFILSPDIFPFIPKGSFADFGKDIFPKLVSANQAIYAYNTSEYIKDVGTIKRLHEVEENFSSGRLQKFNKINPQKAVFIDRDGVINEEVERLDSIEKFWILEGVEEAFNTLNKSNFHSVIVTNRPDIAKGFVSEEQVQRIHNYFEFLLGSKGAFVDRIYYCPHHPEKGHVGEREELKIECNCRKPATGMIETACNEMGIDCKQSFIIGDRTVDIMTGKNAGLHTVLVKTGFAGEDKTYDCQADFVFENLLEAIVFITNSYGKLGEELERIIPSKFSLEKRNAVISVGGLSRTGKSTLITIIRKILQRRGENAKTIDLDDWLSPVDEGDNKMDVRGRCQYEIMNRDIRDLLEGREAGQQKNPRTKLVESNTYPLSLTDGDVLLIEGVAALDNEYLREVADLKLFVHVDEDVRKGRFFAFHRNKRLAEKEIESLYDSRLADESKIISRSIDYANYTIGMETWQ
jgi:D,D-heptose 1,7-bisphosphate phosphatase